MVTSSTSPRLRMALRTCFAMSLASRICQLGWSSELPVFLWGCQSNSKSSSKLKPSQFRRRPNGLRFYPEGIYESTVPSLVRAMEQHPHLLEIGNRVSNYSGPYCRPIVVAAEGDGLDFCWIGFLCGC